MDLKNLNLITRKYIKNLTLDDSGLSLRMDDIYDRRDNGTAIIDGYRSPWVSRMIGKTTPNIPSLPTQLPYKPIDTFTPSDFARNNIQGTLNDLENKNAATMEKLGNVASVAGTAIQGGINMIQDFNSYGAKYSKNDLDAKIGTINTKAGDEDVLLLKLANEDEIMNEQRKLNRSNILASAGKGAAIGAGVGSHFGLIGTGVGTLVGGIGGFIGGLVGSSDAEEEQKKELERQRKAAIAHNDFVTGVAKSRTLSRDYIMRHANTNNQRIFADGKQPNGLVQPGEKIQRVNDYGQVINQITVPGNPAWGDVIPVRLGNKDAVISNKYGLADQADVDPNGALYRQGILKRSGMMKDDMKEHKCGKMPKYKHGKTSDYILNAAAHGLGGLIGLQQYLQAKNDDIYKPNTYVRNPYANRGLGILGSLKTNIYPIMNQLRAAEANGRYGIINSGGLSGSLKNLNLLLNVRNTQQSITDAMLKKLEMDNALMSQYGNALINVGTQEANNMMTAKRADADVYMRSHANKFNEMNTGVYNVYNSMLSWLKNYDKLNQFNRTMANYLTNQAIELEKLKRSKA